MDKQLIKMKTRLCAFEDSLPVLDEEARQHVYGLQLLCELDSHGHFIELRCLHTNYTLRAFLVVNRHEGRTTDVTHTV